MSGEPIHTTLVADETITPPAGCYSLDAYCRWVNPAHGYFEFPHVATGETRRECEADLRKTGWKFHTDGTATCPRCAPGLVKPPRPPRAKRRKPPSIERR